MCEGGPKHSDIRGKNKGDGPGRGGEGQVLSRSGQRACNLEEFASRRTNWMADRTKNDRVTSIDKTQLVNLDIWST